jgi:hypothetical protein
VFERSFLPLYTGKKNSSNDCLQKRLWRILSGLGSLESVICKQQRSRSYHGGFFLKKNFVAEGDQLLPFISVFFFPSDVLRADTASGFEGRI